MSVVVWDGRTLAADRQMVCAGLRIAVSKIRRLNDGTLLGITGTHETGLAMFRWYENGAKREEWPDVQSGKHWTRLIVVRPDGAVGFYEQQPEFQPLLEPFTAWGAGRDFAIGAMAMGADARKAVEITNRFSVDCGMGVEAYDVEAVNMQHTAAPDCECENPECRQCQGYRSYVAQMR